MNYINLREYMKMLEVSSLPTPKVLLLVAVITVFVTFLRLPVFSQTQEFQSITAVEFRDGTIIQGKIIEMNANIVKIQKPDGTIEVRKFSDAKSFIRFGEAKPVIGETISAVAGPTGIPLKRHTFELGPEIFYSVYKEPDPNVKIKGMMYGLVGSYTYNSKIMLKAEGGASVGLVDYSNSGEIDDITNYILEIRGLGGYNFPISKTFFLTPYIGIGYRYLNNDTSDEISTTGAFGYERESNYLYSPLGIGFTASLGKGWSMGGTGEYDYFWRGKQKSHLSDVLSGLNDVENRQKKGYGLRGSLTFQRKLLEVGPFVRSWNIKDSETETLTYYGVPIGYGYEPKNTTTEIGVKLSIKF